MFIEHADFFEGASKESKHQLAEICIPKSYEKKETIFTEGDEGYAFYLLATGSIALYKGSPSGRDIMIKIVQPGEIFAEVILFEQNHYPVTATAVNSGMLFVIPKQQFYCLLNNELFRNDFLSMLMRKQRYLTDKIRYLTMHDVEDRFFNFIEEHFGKKNQVVLNFSKKDIAAAIGATPETYSRLIGRLESEGKIKFDGKTLKILEQNCSS
jgi:CRP/FNR family transcriptional regulator